MECEAFTSLASPLRSVPVRESSGRERLDDVGGHRRAKFQHLVIAGALVVVLLASMVVLFTSGSRLFSGSTSTSAPARAVRTANGLLTTGAKAQLAGQAAIAQSSYVAALKLQPRNATIVYDLGTLAQRWGKATSALSYYNQALVDDPTMTPAMFNKAILVATTDPTEAVAIYQRIVSIQPTASTSYFNLGLVLDTNPATKSQGLSDLAEAVTLDSALKSLVPAGLTLPTVTPIGGKPQPTSTTPKR